MENLKEYNKQRNLYNNNLKKGKNEKVSHIICFSVRI